MQKTIYLAGGCFWGVEKYMGLVPGVVATEVGYANGSFANPTYEQVYQGNTGFAETCRVAYNTTIIDLDGILAHFFNIIDPTTLNYQAGDTGSHYRTGIYYTDPAEETVIATALADLQTKYTAPIVTENLPLSNYYPAEEHHQKYLDKNPDVYCHIPQSKYEQLLP